MFTRNHPAAVFKDLPVHVGPAHPSAQIQLQSVKSRVPPFIQLKGHTNKKREYIMYFIPFLTLFHYVDNDGLFDLTDFFKVTQTTIQKYNTYPRQ